MAELYGVLDADRNLLQLLLWVQQSRPRYLRDEVLDPCQEDSTNPKWSWRQIPQFESVASNSVHRGVDPHYLYQSCICYHCWLWRGWLKLNKRRHLQHLPFTATFSDSSSVGISLVLVAKLQRNRILNRQNANSHSSAFDSLICVCQLLLPNKRCFQQYSALGHALLKTYLWFVLTLSSVINTDHNFRTSIQTWTCLVSLLLMAERIERSKVLRSDDGGNQSLAVHELVHWCLNLRSWKELAVTNTGDLCSIAPHNSNWCEQQQQRTPRIVYGVWWCLRGQRGHARLASSLEHLWRGFKFLQDAVDS